MDKELFSEKILFLYEYIQNEFEKRRLLFINEGFDTKKRITFEYIDLDSIFNDLVKMIPPILEFYNEYQFCHIRKEIYCVFIAALCEISKRGFSQGGILKQIDEYIGFEFRRYHYYPLIKAALKSENIRAFDNAGHPYEAAIAYESGIPKNFHKDIYQLFKIYWKWLKGIDSEERRDFIRAFIEKEPFGDSYIFDNDDYQKMKFLRNEMSEFQEKVIKTCIRMDRIYSEVDKVQAEITEDNFSEVCSSISEKLGYNILTVINEDKIKSDLMESSHCVSFSKFKHILANLLGDEKIVLPTGYQVRVCDYNSDDYICGIHKVHDVTYELVYPYGLHCEDYYELPYNKVIERNEYIFYISDNNFCVEIDGYPIIVHQMIWKNRLIYVFAGKVPSASCAYIDGNYINSQNDIKLVASIRKRWDKDKRINKLILCIDELKIFNMSYAMQKVDITTNISEQTISRQINQHGHIKITEKWIEFEKMPFKVEIFVSVKGQIITSKELTVDDIYIYSLQTGNRIYDQLDWMEWHSDNRIVVFSGFPINKSNTRLEYQSLFFDKFVYLGEIDFNLDKLIIGDMNVNIKKTASPRIKLRSEVDVYNNLMCVQYGTNIKLEANNCNSDSYYLKISHGEERYVGRMLDEVDDHENISLKDCGIYTDNYYGKWLISLYNDQEKIQELVFFVLSKIDISLHKELYEEFSQVEVTLESNNPCFFEVGELTTKVKLQIGEAKLRINGNSVGSEAIEFEIQDANCGYPYRLFVYPNVWSLRSQKNDVWTEISNKKLVLDFEKDNDTSLVLCSTKGQQAVIKSNDMQLNKFFKAGFNRIRWKYLKEKWQTVNDFVIFNTLSESIPFQIRYIPRLKCFYHNYSAEKLTVIFMYTGPIGVSLTITSFINGIKNDKQLFTTDKSAFEIRFVINDINSHNGDNLIIETRIEDEDPMEAFVTKIENCPSVLCNVNAVEVGNIVKKETIDLKKYIYTSKLLNLPNNFSNLEVMRTLDLIELGGSNGLFS